MITDVLGAVTGRESLRLGIVGCGEVVRRGYLPALEGLPDVELAAVADPKPERRRIAAPAAAYPELEAMLEQERLDAVLVCSPPSLHLEHSERCSQAGLKVLVEKPPATSLEQARRFAALSPEPVIGFNRRFARGLPKPAQLGSLTRMTTIFDAPTDDWQSDYGARDPLLELGCHLIDLACWLTGEAPRRARSIVTSADRHTFEVELASGARAYGAAGAADSYREFLELRTDAGATARWQWPLPARRQRLDRAMRRPTALIGSWRDQLRALVRWVREEEPGRLARASDGVGVMAAIEAVRASAASGGRWIELTSLTPGDGHGD